MFAIAIPMLAVTNTSSLPTRIGSAIAEIRRCSDRPRRRGSPSMFVQSNTNSSPPKRARRSPGRSACRRRCATVASRSSPAAWPEAVVDDLEVVEVDEEHGGRSSGRLFRARSAAATRSVKLARFSRPVMASCAASYCSRSLNALRSVMSSIWPIENIGWPDVVLHHRHRQRDPHRLAVGPNESLLHSEAVASPRSMSRT